MKICGLQKTTLLDYPGHVAATIFTGGCNFRCPWCQNTEIIFPDAEADYTADEILSFLKKRRGILEGVCITGGEPTMQSDLPDFIRSIKEMGFLVKLDSNGYLPDRLISLCQSGLLDYVAMDIKAGPGNYAAVAGLSSIQIERIQESIQFLLSGSIPFEFRTTAVKGLHAIEDFQEIGPWIKGCPRYFIQNFKESEAVPVKGFSGFSKEELETFSDCIAPFVQLVELRGIDF